MAILCSPWSLRFLWLFFLQPVQPHLSGVQGMLKLMDSPVPLWALNSSLGVIREFFSESRIP